MVSRGLTIILVSALLVASSAGILWWQSQQILDNYTTIREQKDALEKLNSRTWGVRYQEDNQGRFLVLPEGVKADTNWTFDNGRKNGIRLVQE
ncbi:mobilization protein [Klebsiella quasipneumoniae]|uniref:mobilization protein n=1 Tax=Klebsiella quasipneumoniae TaxID=1463165 RepID=UPI00388F98AB